MKKILAVFLAVFMLTGLVACGGNESGNQKAQNEAPENNTSAPSDEPEKSSEQSEAPSEEQEQESEEPENSEAGDADVASDGEALGYDDPEEYTVQGWLGTTPNNWNPLSHETVDDSEVLAMIESGFYSFDFNHDNPAEGYTIKKEMAAEMPEDLTKDYAGDPNWNVPEGATEGYVYRIKLKDFIKWDDGTPINADSFIYSAKAWLDPKMKNHRADMAYAGGKVYTRAKDYLYQGTKEPVTLNDYIESSEDVADLDALMEKHGDDKVMMNWGATFGALYDPATSQWVEDAEKVKNETVQTEIALKDMRQIFVDRAVQAFGQSEEEANENFIHNVQLEYTYPEVPFEKVGITKEDDLTLVIFMDKPLVGFHLYWNLGLPLVKEDLFEKCKVEKDGEELITSTYGTTIENTASNGPYKLSQFQDDKVVAFERNENWYGYHDEDHKGQYQADKIEYVIVKEPATRLQMFLKGQLDTYSLTPDQVEEYRGSDYIFYNPSSYSGCIQVNTDPKSLEARQKPGLNKTILSLKSFRRALAWSVDRADFAKATTASSTAGFGILNERYIANPDELKSYRSYDDAKKTLLEVYGMEYGEGKEYATLEDAYNALTGYDLDQAKKYFDMAYDEAIEKGLMKEGDKVSLDYYAGEDNENVRRTFNYIKNNWEKALKGTKLEGKFELNLDATAGNDFGKNFRNGLSDILIAGWSGANFDPFYLISAYLNKDYRYVQAFDTTQEVTIEIGGKEYTMSIDKWYSAMMGQKEDPNDPDFGPASASLEDRIKILSYLERAVLEDYSSIPLTYGTSANLRSQKIEFYTDEFNELNGYGAGTDYRTFNYTDSEWDAYISAEGGELDYK